MDCYFYLAMPDNPPVPVFNFEVDVAHTYHVGKSGVLVHNACHGNNLLSTSLQHGYVIYDRNTGQILKFGISGGRITQNGYSYRALQQMQKFTQMGYAAESQIVRYASDRATISVWERMAVFGYESIFGHKPPFNHLP